MTNSQPIRLYDSPPSQPAKIQDIDFGMLQFRFEVLGEALPILARENNLNLTVLQALAKDQDWELLTVTDQEHEQRLQNVVAAANLRLAALKAFREIEKFQSTAKLEDAALAAATRALGDTNISPGQIANLAQVIKTVRYGTIEAATPDVPKAVRATIDVRTTD